MKRLNMVQTPDCLGVVFFCNGPTEEVDARCELWDMLYLPTEAAKDAALEGALAVLQNWAISHPKHGLVFGPGCTTRFKRRVTAHVRASFKLLPNAFCVFQYSVAEVRQLIRGKFDDMKNDPSDVHALLMSYAHG